MQNFEGKLTFIKYHGKSYQSDMSRVQRLYAVSLVSKKFLFPRPLGTKPDKMEIIYEHLPPSQPLYKHVYAQGLIFRKEESSNFELFERIGCALAAIHQYLEPKSAEVASVDLSNNSHLNPFDNRRIKEELSSAPIAGFHSDFGLSNIWIRNSDNKVIVIDPVPSRFCPNPTAGKASIYYDIAQMVAHLWCVYPLWLIPVFDQDRPSTWIKAFLKGYEKEYGIVLHIPTVYAVTLWHLDLYLSNWLKRETSWMKRTARSWYTNFKKKKLIEEKLSVD